MNNQRLSIATILIATFLIHGCVDRITLDFEDQSPYPVVIDGFISDQPPPYHIIVTKAYDIQSKESPRQRISVSKIVLSDDKGASEEFLEASPGVYLTNGIIRGQVGRVYKIYVRLKDGREYESVPDTLYPGGTIDSVYFEYRSDRTQQNTTQYGFDVFFNSNTGENNEYRFLWRFVGTYKVKIPCCLCWPYLYNPRPLVSDGQLIQGNKFVKIKAAYVPITGWTFMNKVHAAVNQMSLSPSGFKFWTAIKDQQEAIGSLFQPITGKIPSNNFVQLSGDKGPVYGIFYATSISSNSVYITRDDVPNQNVIPEIQFFPSHDPPDECIDQFPGSDNVRPDYWID